MSGTPDSTRELDRECELILKKKDYYDILGLNKEGAPNEDEIKKAYKKMAIKFHPDKNQSVHAADTFKKISHAFTTLKDSEKRQFYDKYGTEEEFREKYHQQYAHHEEDDIDPFDLFEMFFSQRGVYQRDGRVFRRPRQREPADNNRQGQVYQGRNIVLAQFLPFFILIIFSVVPYLFQSDPYYKFNRNEEFYRKMTSTINKIDYYVSDRFIKYYNTKESVSNLEPQIEKDYLIYITQQCGQLIKYKNELEYKLSYYRHSTYRMMIENELKGLDFSPCEKYQKYKDVSGKFY